MKEEDQDENISSASSLKREMSIYPNPYGESNSSALPDIGNMVFYGERDEENETTGVYAITRKINSEINSSFLSSMASDHSESTMPLMDSSELNGSLLVAGNDTDFTYWPIRDPLYITIPITVIYGVILVLGLLGNVVTCVVIVRSRYLHTTTNLYLFSLAISDLLLLLSGLPAEMHGIWYRYPYVFGETFCIGRGLAAETSSNATVLTITAFTIERYLAICRPFVIQKWQNKLSRVVRQILVIWVIAIALAIPQALQFGISPMKVGPGPEVETCGVKRVLIEHSFEIATFVFFVAPMILITGLYCMIGFTLRNASRVKESKLRLRKSLSGHKREVGQQRVLKMLVTIVFFFFFCWCPFHAQRLIAIWGQMYLEHNQVLRTTYHILTYVSGVLYYASTCINPILYSVMSLKFRHAFQDNVNKCCGEQSQRKCRSEVLVTINQRSLSHSSRSQNMVMLTEVTSLSNLTGNFVQPINQARSLSHHHKSVLQPGRIKKPEEREDMMVVQL